LPVVEINGLGSGTLPHLHKRRSCDGSQSTLKSLDLFGTILISPYLSPSAARSSTVAVSAPYHHPCIATSTGRCRFSAVTIADRGDTNQQHFWGWRWRDWTLRTKVLSIVA